LATARLKGIISAGTLHDAVEADLGTIPLDRLFSDLDEIFVIRVSGQPMRGADIHDGDYVLLIDEVISEEGIGGDALQRRNVSEARVPR
jgi:repressor LexA